MSGVELLMNNHQSLKAEIDTREDNFSACLSLGKELLSRNHYASQEVGLRATESSALTLHWCWRVEATFRLVYVSASL